MLCVGVCGIGQAGKSICAKEGVDVRRTGWMGTVPRDRMAVSSSCLSEAEKTWEFLGIGWGRGPNKRVVEKDAVKAKILVVITRRPCDTGPYLAI